MRDAVVEEGVGEGNITAKEIMDFMFSYWVEKYSIVRVNLCVLKNLKIIERDTQREEETEGERSSICSFTLAGS